MARAFRILAALAVLIGFGWSHAPAQVPLTGAGRGAPASGATPFTLDGTPVNNTGTNSSFTTGGLTTTFANDVVCLALETNGGPSTSVTNANLTGLAKRTSANTAGIGGQFLELWCGVAASPLSGSTFSVSTTSSSFYSSSAFAFSGAHSAAPFDSNGAIPNQSSTGSAYASCTTTNLDDILIGVVATTTGASSVGGLWIQIKGIDFLSVEYQVVSSAQSALTVGPGNVPGNGGGSICDAIIKGP